MVEGEVDAPVIEWRCSPHYQNTGLYPAIDFYERALGFGREEPPQDRFDRLLRRLEQYDLARPEVVPLWASLLSLPTPDRFPAALAVAGPAEGRDVPAHAGVAARARRPQAGPVRRRGPALGGRVHPGVPGAVPRRVPARPNPDRAHLPPRVQAAVARRRPPDQPGPEPPDPAPGRRPDAEEGGGRPAGRGDRAGLRPGRRRAAVRRRVHEDGAGIGRRSTRRGQAARAARPCSGTRSPARSRTW